MACTIRANEVYWFERLTRRICTPQGQRGLTGMNNRCTWKEPVLFVYVRDALGQLNCALRNRPGFMYPIYLTQIYYDNVATESNYRANTSRDEISTLAFLLFEKKNTVR